MESPRVCAGKLQNKKNIYGIKTVKGIKLSALKLVFKNVQTNFGEILIFILWHRNILGWQRNCVNFSLINDTFKKSKFFLEFFNSMLALKKFHCSLFYAKGQLISKANSKLFIWPKKKQKYFCICALASNSGRIKKI